MTKTKSSSRQQNAPEKRIGPFLGGVGVAIWLNTVETDDGPRQFRSVTISPRRYLDSETGEWKDSHSYRPGDLPALIFALQKAQEFIYTSPLQEDQEDARTPF